MPLVPKLIVIIPCIYLPHLQNPVGAGQYDINRWHAHRHVNANRSVFVSGTPRLPKKVDSPRELLLNERIHPKGIPVSKKQFLVPVEAMH